MKGCLTWPLRLAVALLVTFFILAGWAYRRELAGMWRFWRSDAPKEASVTGSASAAGLARATDLVDSLNGWRADSIVLTADELASLLQAGLGGAAARYLDSVQVTLGTDHATVRAMLATEAIPRRALGPFRRFVRARERISVGGRLAVLGPEAGALRVDAVSLRGLPFPTAMIGRFMSTSLDASEDGTVRFQLPKGIRDLKVRPSGVVLYGGGR
ncbi:MAG TPA: hypothetical protein VG940_01575 [Gemmatimonadales bacterium]|nr:hypothetical protein [Gemmatimonadales bacterium]